jgi:hypothetical protein
MPRYVFHMEIQRGQHDELRRLNDRYEPALARAAGGLPGFGGFEKYVLGDQYVEVIDYDGPFEEFGRGIAADPEARDFLRAVGACFMQSLREMGERRMTCIQHVRGGNGG